MTEEQKESLAAIYNEILAMEYADAQGIYNVECAIARLADGDIKDYAKGYSRQRIIEQLNYIVDILDARVSMQMIADNEWDPEETPARPELEDQFAPEDDSDIPTTPGKPSIKPSTPDEDTPDEEPKLNFFQRIWQAILNFFRNLFGGKKD